MVEAASPCPADELLAQLVDGTLAGEAAEGVRGHLDGCASCRAVAGALARAQLATTEPGPRARRTRAASTPPALGRYRLERLVGAGGMGQVWAAHDTELDRPVAVKVMRPELAALSPAFAERLRRESRLMARVQHPAVITIHDIGVDAGRIYLAMELVAGTTLGVHLARARRDWRAIVRWFRAAGAGLAAAHAAGLVHRDFKPDNVLVALDGDRVTRVVVTDFGVARALADDEPASGGDAPRGDLRLTATGLAIGTPAYMAPEQLAGERVDARADVFAFAVSLWEALWGARPYPGGSLEELRAAFDAGSPPVARRAADAGDHVPTDAPRWLARALAPALALAPGDRPTLAALLAALDLDRRRTRRIAAAAVAGLVVAGAGATAIAIGVEGPRAADPCAAGLAALEASWTPPRQAGFERALAGLPVELRGRVHATLAARQTAWRDTYQRACRADPATTPARPLQLACLDARRIELAGYLEGVIDLPDGGRHAAYLIEALTDPTGCQAPAPASVYSQLPADPALRARILPLRYATLDGEQVRQGSDFAGALAVADRLRPEVEATGWLPLAAELEYLAGTAASMGGDSQRSEAILRKAASLAERAHHDYLAAVARTALAQDAALNTRDLDGADQHVEFAQAAIERLGGDPLLQTHLDSTRLVIRELRGDLAGAERLIADLLGRAALPPDVEIQVRGQLGDLRFEQVRLRDAIAEHRRAIELLEAMGPAGAANLGIMSSRLSDDLALAGDAPGALAAAERGVAIAAEVIDPAHVDRWMPYYNLAEALRLSGRLDDALAAATTYRRELERLQGTTGVYAAEAARLEGRLLAERGRAREAEARLARACTLIEIDPADRETTTLAECEFDQAEARLRAGDPRAALPVLERTVAAVAAELGAQHPTTAIGRVSIAEALLELGRAREAVPVAAAALAVLAASELDPGHAADAGFVLARARAASGDRAGARAALDEALARFAGTAPAWADRRAEAARWRARLR